MDIGSLTIEEKVGQLFIVGFNGTKMSGELMHLLTYFNVGGLVYTKNNIRHLKQIHQLSTNVQFYAKTGLPLFIGMNQAGGDENTITERLTTSPSQATIARANNRLYTKQMAEFVAKELRGIGVNMNFAPILNTDENNEENSFGDNIDLIAKHGVAAIQGYEKGQVCSIVKLLGNNPKIDFAHIPLDDKTSELYPFFHAMKKGASGVLISDAMFQPSVTSGKSLGEILRTRLSYNGLFITKMKEQQT